MISPEQLRQKAARKYKEFLFYTIEVWCGVPAGDFFPLVIRADTGSVNDELLVRQKELRDLLGKSKNRTGSGYTLDLETVRSRNNGEQTDVSRIYFETEDDFLVFIHKEDEYLRFCSALEQVQQHAPLPAERLCEWAKSHLAVLSSEKDGEHFWSDVGRCARWLNTHQDSHLYIREIPLPVHTKFIEHNERIIRSLTEKADEHSVFEYIFGLKTKPDFVRFRSLAASVTVPLAGMNVGECQVLLADFKNLPAAFYSQIQNVFIVENEMVYLTFPAVPRAICIWGQGYKVTVLNDVRWFGGKNLYYFGDLDEHGFDILSMYRTAHPQTQSFCMESEVLDYFKDFLTAGKTLDGGRVPENLTAREWDCFMRVRYAPRNANRLEQERVSVEYIKQMIALAKIF